jgi:hypothetical protein
MNFIMDCFAKSDTAKIEDAKEVAAAAAPPPPPPPKPPPKLTYSKLKKQDATTSATIIEIMADDETFVAFAESEAEDIIQRDDEDGVKLQAGIQISIDKGVLPVLLAPPQYLEIDVIGKSPDAIAAIIMKDMGKAATEGGVLVLCGLSGTGIFRPTTSQILYSGPAARKGNSVQRLVFVGSRRTSVVCCCLKGGR